MNSYGHIFSPSIPSVPCCKSNLEPILVGTEYFDYTYSITEGCSSSDYPIAPVKYNNIQDYGSLIFVQQTLYRNVPLYYYKPEHIQTDKPCLPALKSCLKCPQKSHNSFEATHFESARDTESQTQIKTTEAHVDNQLRSQNIPNLNKQMSHHASCQNYFVDNGPQPIVQSEVNRLILPSSDQDFEHLLPRSNNSKLNHRPPEVIAEYIEILEDRHCKPEKRFRYKEHRRTKYEYRPKASDFSFRNSSCCGDSIDDYYYRHSSERSYYRRPVYRRKKYYRHSNFYSNSVDDNYYGKPIYPRKCCYY